MYSNRTQQVDGNIRSKTSTPERPAGGASVFVVAAFAGGDFSPAFSSAFKRDAYKTREDETRTASTPIRQCPIDIFRIPGIRRERYLTI
jgi:hypothetical protein